MSSAVLFRGYAHREPGKIRSWGCDWRPCLGSQRKFLIEPIADRYGYPDIFLTTYATPFLEEVKSDYDCGDRIVLSPEGSTQGQVVAEGLRIIAEASDKSYDFVAVCRFDLRLMLCPLSPRLVPDRVNFLWREWEEALWLDHNRIGDAIFFMPGSLVAGFRRGVLEAEKEISPEPKQSYLDGLHKIYRSVARNVGGMVHVMDDSYKCTNTPVMANGIFELVRVIND